MFNLPQKSLILHYTIIIFALVITSLHFISHTTYEVTSSVINTCSDSCYTRPRDILYRYEDDDDNDLCRTYKVRLTAKYDVVQYSLL